MHHFDCPQCGAVLNVTTAVNQPPKAAKEPEVVKTKIEFDPSPLRDRDLRTLAERADNQCEHGYDVDAQKELKRIGERCGVGVRYNTWAEVADAIQATEAWKTDRMLSFGVPPHVLDPEIAKPTISDIIHYVETKNGVLTGNTFIRKGDGTMEQVVPVSVSFGDGLVRDGYRDPSYDRLCAKCGKVSIHRTNTTGMCPNCYMNVVHPNRPESVDNAETK